MRNPQVATKVFGDMNKKGPFFGVLDEA